MKMKLFVMALLAAGLFVACKKGEEKKEGEGDKQENAEGKEGENAEAGSTKLSKTGTYVEFHAKKGNGGGHDGKFYLVEGELTGEGGKITGGKLVFDLNTLEITDAQPLDDENAGKLKGHLMSKDFFNVEANGSKVTYEITSVEGRAVNGKLTLGGKTLDNIALTLDAEPTVDENDVNGAGTAVKGSTVINLSTFGVNNFEKDGAKPVVDNVKVDFVLAGK